MLTIDNSQGDILEGTMQHYSNIFMNMVLEGNFSQGFSWSIGGKNRARQVSFHDGKMTEKMLSPSDLGLIAIAVSLGVGNTLESRMAHQYFLMNLGIINTDDIEDHASHFIGVTRPEHITRAYLHHMVESAAIITALRRAYEQLNREKKWGRLKEKEDRILLGYVVSLLGGKYAIRPYMIDEEMSHQESWVEYYDHVFDEFSQSSFMQYNGAGFGRIWSDFLDLRNDIALKKDMPVKHIKLPNEVIGETVRKAARDVLLQFRY